MLHGRPWFQPTIVVGLAAVIVVAILSKNTDLRVGLFGLAGTLIGAFTTIAGTELAARRAHQEERRIAGRLLQEDLRFARTRCRYAIKNECFWASRLDLRFEDWQRYRETAARELDDTEAWNVVTTAFDRMRAVQSNCSARRVKFNTDVPPLGDTSRLLIEAYLKRSKTAMKVLKRLSGDLPVDEAVVFDPELKQPLSRLRNLTRP
jgi:hypothetical protein